VRPTRWSSVIEERKHHEHKQTNKQTQTYLLNEWPSKGKPCIYIYIYIYIKGKDGNPSTRCIRQIKPREHKSQKNTTITTNTLIK
jgi:hypothetical protein